MYRNVRRHGWTMLVALIGAPMLAQGPGSESRSTLGIVMFWGISIAAVFTLFVVPVFYSLFARATGTPDAVSKKLEALKAEG